MDNPGAWIPVVPIAWGLYKCNALAQRRTTNRKSVHALTAMLAVWLVLFIIVGSGVPEGGAQLLLAAGVLLTGVPIAAIVLAVLGLREIGLSHRAGGRSGAPVYTQGAGQAIGAIVAAAALLVPFTLYAGKRFFGTRAPQGAVGANPNWTAFVSPGGDFEVRFPGVPQERELTQAASGGRATTRAYVASFGPAMYMVSQNDDPSASMAGAGAALDTWEKTIQEQLPGRVLDRTNLATDKFAAREIRGMSATNRTAYEARAVVVDGHIYFLAVTMPETVDQRELVDLFFKSFTLRRAGVAP